MSIEYRTSPQLNLTQERLLKKLQVIALKGQRITATTISQLVSAFSA